MCAVGRPGPGAASGQVSSDWAQMECKKDVVAARLRNVAMCTTGGWFQLDGFVFFKDLVSVLLCTSMMLCKINMY